MFNYWNGLLLGSVQTYFLEVAAYVSLKWATISLFGWIWLKKFFFFNIKTEECDLKVLFFHYRNGLALGSVQTDFPEVSGYVSLKRATAGFWGRISWTWVKSSQCSKYKNRAVEPNNFIVQLVKWSCLRLSRKFFSQSWCTVCLKRTTVDGWECRFCWTWVKRLQFPNYK